MDEKEKWIGTIKYNCSFALRGRMIDNSSNWKLTINCDIYNHRLTQYLECRPYTEKFTNEEMNLLVGIIKCNIRSKHILYKMKQHN